MILITALHRHAIVLGLLFSLSIFPASAEDNSVVFRIDDMAVTEGILLQYHQAKGYPETRSEQQRQARQLNSSRELINIYLLSREAEKAGLEKQESVQQALALSRRIILMKAMVEKYQRDISVSDEELNAAYKTMQAEAEQSASLKISSIIVDNQQTAEKVLQQLDAGEPFEKLQASFSTENFAVDTSATTDWLDSDTLQPELYSRIVNLRPGEITSKPVKTAFGWHIVRIEDRKTVMLPPIDEIRDDLAGMIRQKKLREEIARLRQAATIEIPAQPADN